MKKTKLLLFLAAVLLFWFRPALAVTPISQYLDLVAGSGEPGYRDGTFTSAMFKNPSSAVFSEDKTKIFVADSGNNRIRVVDLEHQNAVSTLAGTGERGETDGLFKDATFSSPQYIAAFPGNILIVYDESDCRFRRLDVSTGKVTTLRSSGSPGGYILASGVAGMVSDPKSFSIYFTEPYLEALNKMDISTGTITRVRTDARVPHPLALCFFNDHLCVADRDLPSVFQVDDSANTLSAAATTAGLTEIAKGEKIIAMAASDGILYAFQAAEIPWVRLTAGPGMPAGEVKFMSVWGPFLEPKTLELQGIMDFIGSPQAGLLPFPGEPRKFLYISNNLNQIFTLRDYAFDEFKNSQYDKYPENPNGLTDFSYPEAKPPHTFRILMMGDSRVFYESEHQNRWPWGFHRQETTPKKLEQDLNFEASLDDVPTHFQVLTYARYAWAASLQVWPYFWGVEPVKKFDIDAVILLMPNDLTLPTWFNQPYVKEGIPDVNVTNPEYMLKPVAEKISHQPLEKDFYERCLKHKWVPKNKLDFADIRILATDPLVWSDLVQMVGRPMSLYQEKLKSLEKQLGHPVRFYVFFVPVGSSGGTVPVDAYRKLYTEAYPKAGIDLEDLTDPWTALKISGYPVGEFWGMHHFDNNGHNLLSFLIAHRLIRDHLIPFDPAK